MKTLLKFTYELAWFLGTGLVIMLAPIALDHWNSYQRVSTFLAAQEAGPPTQNADDSLDGLLNEETAPKTTADENTPPRSIFAQLFDFMSDNEFAVYLGLTGETAEQLDQEEKEFVKIIQSNPKLYEAHLHEAVAKHAARTSQFFANKFGENWASTVDTNHLFFQLSIFHEAEREALRRTKNGELTDQQQEAANMKRFLARERENYQSQTDGVWQGLLKNDREREKRNPHNEKYKYKRMKSELRLAQAQAEFELHRPLWVHLGFLPEDNVHKQDKTLQYYDLISMSVRIAEEARKKEQELWNAADPKLRAWITAEEEKEWAIHDRADTLTNEAEWDSWWTLWVRDFDLAASIAMDDAKFALWRASVNEAASPPAENPGGLLLEETSPLPAPVTNTDDSGETSPTPAPSPGSEEETTSGNLGDDASPGSDGPTVPGGLGVIAGLNFALLFSTVGFSSSFLLWLRWGESQTRRHDDWREHERVTSPNGNLEKSGGKLETKLEMVIEERFQRFEKNLKRMESSLTAKIDKIDEDIRGNGKDGLNVRVVRLESIKNWAIWIIPLTVIPIITAFLGVFFVYYFSNLEKR